MRRLSLLLTALLLVLTATTAIAGSASAAEEMTTAKAGRYYLKWACKTQPAQTSFDRVFFGSDDIFYAEDFASINRNKLRKKSLRFARAEYRFARRISNPPAEWPASVRREAYRIARINAKNGRLLRKMSQAQSGGRASAIIDRINRQIGKIEDDVIILRLELNLPDSGRGC